MVATVVQGFEIKSSPDELVYAREEIEAELREPTQSLKDVLPNSNRTEEECRAFLEEVLAALKARSNVG